MGTPTGRHTKRSRNSRRSHQALKGIQVVRDADGSPRLPHQANPATGAYKGRAVVNVQKRTTRRAKHLKPVK